MVVGRVGKVLRLVRVMRILRVFKVELFQLDNNILIVLFQKVAIILCLFDVFKTEKLTFFSQLVRHFNGLQSLLSTLSQVTSPSSSSK